MVAPTLIDCWHVRDLQRFRALLKGGLAEGSSLKGSSSYGAYSKSPHSHGNQQLSGPCPPSEVNRRDSYGRTALHLIASCSEPWSVDYLHAILSHTSININLQDGENGWTALHRALYSANLVTVLILLRRSNLDTKVKDLEGLTPFDLYNSTVAGTNPVQDGPSGSDSPMAAAIKGRTLSQLYSWGSNRNFTLGLGNGDDRSLPDRVKLNKRTGEWQGWENAAAAGKKFDRIGIRDVVMGKLHTVVLTDEKSSNVWVCGLGGNGRLGRSPQTQPAFEPLQDFRDTAKSVAVAQDHTIIVTTSGAAYTFGLNRFAQLGYPVEQGQGIVGSSSSSTKGGATFGAPVNSNAAELDTQISPRRIAGGLKKESVLGAAASKLHSVVFTSNGLYTWGTNTGQLGYDRAGTPVQIYPRKVTALAADAGIKQVAATEFGTACLMESWDVIVWHNDTHYRINFPLSRFASDISVFRPRQVQPKSWISKLTSSGNTFAALSDMGDLFTFNLEHPSQYGGSTKALSQSQGTKVVAAQSVPRAQLVWSVRKKFTAVRDVDIGSDGSIILCTESGHVYVRSRKNDAGGGKAGGKNFKFQAVPYLQRVVKVAINESGGLAAIKVDPPLPEVRMKGRTLEEALRDLLPHLKAHGEKGIAAKVVDTSHFRESESDDGDSEDEVERSSSNEKHVNTALLIAEAAKRWTASKNGSQDDDEAKAEGGLYGPYNLDPPFGCDAFLIAGGHYLPVHRVVLAARLPLLRAALQDPAGSKRTVPEGVQIKLAQKNVATIVLPGCSFGTALFLLHYVYSDDLPPVWTPSVGLLVDRELKAAKIDRMQVHQQLLKLVELLQLSTLEASLRAPAVNALTGTLRDDMSAFFTAHVAVDDIETSSFRDVELLLSDRVVPAHSAILRRSPFFAALFQPQWTSSRWSDFNIIQIDMRHLRWEVARIVIMHLYTDQGEDLFQGIDKDRSMEQYMDFVVEVMAASNELLLDKLKLVCCTLLRNRILSQNVGAVMTEADFYDSSQLKDITMDYCTKSLETLLESGMLDELEYKVLKDLTHFVRKRQDERMRRTSAYDRVLALVEKHREYYDDLDIPEPSLHLVTNKVQPKKPRKIVSPFSSPELRPKSDLMFMMDEEESPWTSMSQLSLDAAKPWKAKTVEAEKREATPATDLRSIMAAEERRKSNTASPVGSGSSTPVPRGEVAPMTKMSQKERKRLAATPVATPIKSPPPSSSPWKLSPAQPSATPTIQRRSSATPSIYTLTRLALKTRPSEPAWSSPSSPPPPSNLHRSFAQIQEQQRQAELANAVTVEKKSFVDILQEEKEEQRRKEQAEFEEWFEMESRRVQGQGSRKEGKKSGGGARDWKNSEIEGKSNVTPEKSSGTQEKSNGEQEKRTDGAEKKGKRKQAESSSKRSAPTPKPPRLSGAAQAFVPSFSHPPT